MKEIKLTQGQVALVDDADFDTLSKYKWCARKQATQIGFVAMRGFQLKNKRIQCVLMHRDIMKPPSDMTVDHINHNTLDNRRVNLRVCTNRENCINKGITKSNTSGFKGVSYNKKNKKWVAYVKNNQKIIHLGYFIDKVEAAKIYNREASKIFGEFALLNVIPT